MNTLFKKDGFLHEKLIVVPKNVIANSLNNPIVSSLYVTDIGYFPSANGHRRQRETGSDNHIFIFCVDGKGSIELPDGSYLMEKGHFCIIPAGMPHTYQADFREPWSIYWCHFNGTLSKAYIDLVSKNTFITKLDQIQHSSLIRRFYNCYSLLEKGYCMENMVTLANMLGLLLSGTRYTSDTRNEVTDSKNPVDLCIDYMLANTRIKLDLDELTRQTSISKSHLIHLFKEQTGFTPIDYFIHLKIQKACSLLDTTGLSIKEIGYHLGYDDSLYFSRIFRKIMGDSPKKYRDIQKG